MILHLNPKSKTPLYIQLYEEVKNKIMQEELEQGQKLPSKRQMAQDNGISQNTVINAYEQLLVEGYIRSEERRGYFVEDIDFQMSPLKVSKKEKNKSTNEAKDKKNVLDLTRSNPDPSLFPNSLFAKIFNRLLRKQDPRYLGVTEGQGLYDLREVLATYLEQSRGVPCRPEQLVLAPNSQYLLSVVFNLYPDMTEMAMEEPGYQGYESFLKLSGIKKKPIPVEKEGISISSLKQSGADMLFVTPNHQFPTGSIMPLDRRQNLLTWANEKSRRLIIEDDYDGEFKYSGIPVPPLIQLDHREKVIYMGSFTRILAPGLRLAYMVLPESVLKHYQTIYQGVSSPLNTMVQYALLEFFKEGYFTSHLNRSRRLYKKKRDLLIQAIKKEDPKAEIYGEEAGLSILVRPVRPFNGQALKQLAKESNIRLSLLSDYMHEPEEQDEDVLFFSFSFIPEDEIESLIKKISNLMDQSVGNDSYSQL